MANSGGSVSNATVVGSWSLSTSLWGSFLRSPSPCSGCQHNRSQIRYGDIMQLWQGSTSRPAIALNGPWDPGRDFRCRDIGSVCSMLESSSWMGLKSRSTRDAVPPGTFVQLQFVPVIVFICCKLYAYRYPGMDPSSSVSGYPGTGNWYTGTDVHEYRVCIQFTG